MAELTGSKFDLTATGTAEIGPNKASMAEKTVRVISLDGTFVGSTVIKGRVRGSGTSFYAIPYIARVVAGAVSTDTIATAALTGKSIVEVNDTELELQLDFTWTSGTMNVTQRSA